MTQENDPFGNVEDLIASLDTAYRQNRPISAPAPIPVPVDAPQLTQGTEIDETYDLSLAQFQVKILVAYFNGKTLTSDIQEMAGGFKSTYEAERNEMLTRHTLDSKTKRHYEDTTLESLSKLSKEQHEDFIIKSGQSLPGSKEETENRKEADMWGLIDQVVKAAAEIKD